MSLLTFFLSSDVTRYWMVTLVINICVHTRTYYHILSHTRWYHLFYITILRTRFSICTSTTCLTLITYFLESMQSVTFLVPPRTVCRCGFRKEPQILLRLMVVLQETPYSPLHIHHISPLDQHLILRSSLTGHSNWVTSIATTSEDPNLVISSSRDKSVLVWTLTHACSSNDLYGYACCALCGHSHFLSGVVISSDGQFALSGSWDGTLRLWEINSRKIHAV